MLILTALILIMLAIDVLISLYSVKSVHSSISKLPNARAGLVLGTKSRLSDGRPNLFYKFRMDAAEEVYKSGKIEILLVSGHSDGAEYNEAEEMKADLTAKGIPAEDIIMDPAGSRTINSIIRAKYTFGYDSLIIISQKFHNQRALFIAGDMKITASGFNAENVTFSAGMKTRIREVFARTRMFFELLVKKPPG